MTIQKPALTLAVALMMFPQIAETIYSPALTDIAQGFGVSAAQAGQTLSLYFFAFALGVVTWGRLCDIAGRRRTMLSGLILYATVSCGAVITQDFSVLLILRMLSAFGAAVGSVGTQTIMRDCYRGDELAKVFSVMGIALAVSPALGMFSGAALTGFAGYQGVFTGLAVLAVVLLAWTALWLPETRPAHITSVSLQETAGRMLCDRFILRNVLLIAFLNISLFSYYQLAPFYFSGLGFTQQEFGYSGLLLALGVAAGSVINRVLLKHGWHSHSLIRLAAVTGMVSAAAVWLLSGSILFVLPVTGIVICYGLAIPNILAGVLQDYRDRPGTAGALLGLMYYLLIGGGLALAGLSQNLGMSLCVCAAGTLLCAPRKAVQSTRTA
ncbi:multidrug effflux MFS transporter [Morganella morganii subsp. morganii]|uniref:multidrug effflux MFS transporter n=1 Tax=Morganella morganii TaxID=582 RepID=UPI001BD92510|nr:multidrug effflux MFS transporter [Morganella morganii]MBT0367720.1 multidrug effflux MFS transporter [Morganella morganii subsp. morganii]MBT0512717.1 multidrug effflux MFS transporter [Morganella morganii subsp. morganii]